MDEWQKANSYDMKHLFSCGYCHEAMGMGGLFESPKECRAHEKVCEWNPKVRSCVTCRHLEVDERCLRRRVRPRCGRHGDRKYRQGCQLWEAKQIANR